MATEPSDHPRFEHVVSQIGIHVTDAGHPCGAGMHLHLSPLLLEPDGHVDFGALGVFLDMASVQVEGLPRYIHADISVHRIDRPRGERLFVEARTARRGGRSAVIHLDVHDELGTRVAYSVQQLRFTGEQPPTDSPEATMFRAFLSRLDGVCRLPGQLHESLGIRRDSGPAGEPVWRMPLTATSRNSWGGLHGGAAFALVGDAAAGAAAAPGREAKTTSALLRYLTGGTSGPFRAVPHVMPQADGDAFVRVDVLDEGADDRLIILAEVHVVLPTPT